MFLPLGDDVEHRTFPLVGIFLIMVNVLVFAYMLRLFNGDFTERKVIAFVEAYGLKPADLARGELLGVISHMFLHADIWHIAGNMVVLWAFVQTLEGALGYLAFAFFYFLWGTLAALAHSAMSWGDEMPMIGASGAIAGMIGAYCVAFGPTTRIKTLIWFIRPYIINIPAGIFVLIWIGMQLLGVASEEAAKVGAEPQGGVAWYAHLGGFLAGALTMSCIGSYTKGRLVESVHGHLHFEDAEEQDAAAQALEDDQEEEISEAPDECPHCGTPLSEESAWAANLLRCPNPECQRMIYLEATEAGTQ